MWGCGLDRAESRYGQVAGTFECGNEPSGSIKCGEFRVSGWRDVCELHGYRKHH